MNDTINAIGAILAAIVGLAIVAVIVSKNAQTSSVISSAGGALSGVIQAAVAPVSGGGSSVASIGNPLMSAFASPFLPGIY